MQGGGWFSASELCFLTGCLWTSNLTFLPFCYCLNFPSEKSENILCCSYWDIRETDLLIASWQGGIFRHSFWLQWISNVGLLFILWGRIHTLWIDRCTTCHTVVKFFLFVLFCRPLSDFLKLISGFGEHWLHKPGSIPVLIKDSLERVTCFRLYWFGNVTQFWICLWHYVNVT